MFSRRPLSIATAALLAGLANAGELTVEKNFSSAADFDPFFRDTQIDLFSAPGAITLRRETGFVAGAAPTASGQARQTFVLPDDRNGGAEIFAFAGAAGAVLLNDVPLTFRPCTNYGGWVRAEAPAEALKAGPNELAASTNATPGESGGIVFHIRVRRYPANGTITSPVIDLAAAGTGHAIVPLFRIRSLDIQWRAIVPGSASAVIEARTGPSLWPDEDWTPWTGADRVLPGRFAQVRATLKSGAGDVAPTLARLTITARGEAVATPENQGYTLRDCRNPPLVRGSFPYAFQRPSEKLARLRDELKLDDVVAAGQTDLDKARLLFNWAQARENLAFLPCALALGFNARPVILDGHETADIWCKEPGKWMLLDAGSNVTDGIPPYDLDIQAGPFTRRSDRAGDIAWSVHQAQLVLTCTETPGVLSVAADTVTPNLKSFRFAASGQDPVIVPGDGADPDSRRARFTWRLAPGMNTLSVTTVNRFDRDGRAATVCVEWKQP